jgi:hypothetical protein
MCGLLVAPGWGRSGGARDFLSFAPRSYQFKGPSIPEKDALAVFGPGIIANRGRRWTQTILLKTLPHSDRRMA